MGWVYISPHLDDVALSCGGLLWEQAQSGLCVSVWTICAGDPPPGPFSPFAESLHTRWETGREAVSRRRDEDIESCTRMGASWRHFSVPDCVYRRGKEGGAPLYASEETIFGPLQTYESHLVRSLSVEIAESIQGQDREHPGKDGLPRLELVCPLALGGHVDHRLVRAAIERTGYPVWYYADYPYVREHAGTLTRLKQQGWKAVFFPITENGLAAWELAIAAHASQISTFWPDLPTMKAAISAYLQPEGGIFLWKPPLGLI